MKNVKTLLFIIIAVVLFVPNVIASGNNQNLPAGKTPKAKFNAKKEMITSVNDKMEYKIPGYVEEYDDCGKNIALTDILDAATKPFDVHVRTKSTDKNSPSSIQIIQIPVRPDKPEISVDMVEELLLRVDSTFEYNISSKPGKWRAMKKTDDEGFSISKLPPKNEEITVKVRVSATKTTPAGFESEPFILRPRPIIKKDDVRIDYENEVLEGMNGKQYSLEIKEKDWITDDIEENGILELDYIMDVGSESIKILVATEAEKTMSGKLEAFTFASKPLTIKIPARPKAPKLKYDEKKGEIKIKPPVEWYFNDDKTPKSTEDERVIKVPQTKGTYTYKVRKAATNKAFSSEYAEISIDIEK